MTSGQQKSSRMITVVLILSIAAGIGCAGWFGYKFIEKKRRQKEELLAQEAKKAALAAEIDGILKSAVQIYGDAKYDEALALAESALKKDPENARAKAACYEMSQAIALMHLLPAKKLAELSWAQARDLAPGQGFGTFLKAVEEAYNEAASLFTAKEYTKAKPKYEEVASSCERLKALDQERQQARKDRDASDVAREAAERAGASSEAKDLWIAAQEKSKEATVAFEKSVFGDAGEAWKKATGIFTDAQIFSAGTVAVRSAEEGFNKELSVVRAGVLDTFGGNMWSSTKSTAEGARLLSRAARWNDSVAKWSEAVNYLRLTIKTAEYEEAKYKMLKKYEAMMDKAGEQLAAARKAPKTDISNMKVLAAGIEILDLCRKSEGYESLLTAEARGKLDTLYIALQEEKFHFRFPDMVRAQPSPEVAPEVVLPGGDKVLAEQKKSVTALELALQAQTREMRIEMRLIPAGQFEMGSSAKDEDADSDEFPAHKVTINRPLYMSTFEVTQEQWLQAGMRNPSHFSGFGAASPVESVTFDEAQEFCRRLCVAEGVPSGTYRLPTESEWEYACRAGTTTRYYNGNNPSQLDRMGWFDKNGGSRTHAVGQKMPNAYGLYDMHGNVWEWCVDGVVDYTSADATDPHGPEKGWIRGTRGGSWNDEAAGCRSANRGWARRKNARAYDIGFRIVRTLPELQK